MNKELVEAIAKAVGRVVTRGEIEPRKGWLEAAKAALSAIEREGYVIVEKERLVHLGRLAKVLPEDCLRFAAAPKQV